MKVSDLVYGMPGRIISIRESVLMIRLMRSSASVLMVSMESTKGGGLSTRM